MSVRTLMPDTCSPDDVLGRTLELPCGAILKNRLAKSAMSDSLGNGEGDPTEAQIRLYERWAEGGAAVSISGEVQGDPRSSLPSRRAQRLFSMLRILARTDAASVSPALASMRSVSSRYRGKRSDSSLNPL